MTEESYQQGRKVMATANNLRGLITSAKGNVAKWTHITAANISNGQQEKAGGTQKLLDKAMKLLEERRTKFAALKFPDSDIQNVKTESVQCEGCGAKIAKGNTYCGECLCED